MSNRSTEPRLREKKLKPPKKASRLSKSSSSESLHAAVAAADRSSPAPPGRSSRSRRKLTMDDESQLPDDDALSTTSSSSTSSALDGSVAAAASSASSASAASDPASRLHDIIDSLAEKRASTRVSGMESLVSLLCSAFLPAEVRGQQETLVMFLLAGVKKGDGKEVETACHALQLVAITAEEGDDTVQRLTSAALTDLMRNRSRPPGARAAAVRTLAFFSFLVSEHDDESLQLMEKLLSLLSAHPTAASVGLSELETAVFDSWGLLATSLPSHVLLSLLVQHMALFTAFLHSESVDVRMSVGEDIALLFSAYHQQRAEQAENEDDAEDDAAPEASAPAPPVLLSPTDHHHRQIVPPSATSPSASSAASLALLSSSLHHNLLPLLTSLSTDGSRHRARKERKTQRASFRDVLSSVETGEEPSIRVEVRRERRDVTGWRQLKRWQAVVEAVEQGLAAHITDNPLVQQAVGGDAQADAGQSRDGEAADDGLDDRGRRLAQRAESRSRAKEMYQYSNKQRAKKMAQAMGED